MDDKIKEVMGLVCSYGLLCADYDTDECDLALSRMGIESKLRELVPVWLPIDSAPLVGSVLVKCEDDPDSVGVAHWENHPDDEMGPESGWYSDGCVDGVYRYFPTKWMPLP